MIQRYKAKITKQQTTVCLDLLFWVLGCCYNKKTTRELYGWWLKLLSDGPSRSGGIQKLAIALSILAIHLAIKLEDCRLSPSCRSEVMKWYKQCASWGV